MDDVHVNRVVSVTRRQKVEFVSLITILCFCHAAKPLKLPLQTCLERARHRA